MPMTGASSLFIDPQQIAQARERGEAMALRRPWRGAFFVRIVAMVADLSGGAPCRVLELGSGPGLLAEALLTSLPRVQYCGLDNQPAMHCVAAERVGPNAARASFMARDLQTQEWSDGLGDFDFVLAFQVVHMLGHKRAAAACHAQARKLLRPGGTYLMCDPYLGAQAMSDAALFMTPEEQSRTLHAAGFGCVELVFQERDLVLFKAN